MADARTDILLTINSNLEGIRKAQEAFLGLKQNAKEASDSIGTMFKQAATWTAGAVLGFTAVKSALEGVQSFLKSAIIDGVHFNAEMEQTKIAIAGVMRQFGGSDYSNFQSAMVGSGKLLDQLKAKAGELGIGFIDLVDAYKTTAGAMFGAGIRDAQKQIQLVTTIQSALRSLGISGFTAVRDTQDILIGQAERTKGGRELGLKNEELNAARESGTLYEYLTEKLKGYSEAAAFAANSTTALETRLKNDAMQTAAEATGDLTTSYRELLKSLDDLVKSDSAKSLLTFLSSYAEQAVHAATSVASIFSSNTPSNSAAYNSVIAQGKGLQGATTQGQVDSVIKTASDKIAVLKKEYNDAIKNDSPGYLEVHTAQILEIKANWDRILDAAKRRGSQILEENAALAAQQARLQGIRSINDANKKQVTDLEKDAVKNREAEDVAGLKVLTNFGKLEALRERAIQQQIALKLSPTATQLAQIDEKTGKPVVTESDKIAAESERAQRATELLKTQREIEVVEKAISAEKAKQTREDAAAAKSAAAALDHAVAKRLTDEADERERQQKAAVEGIKGNRSLTNEQKRGLLYERFKAERDQLPYDIFANQAGYDNAKPDSSMQTYYRGQVKRLKDRQEVGNPADLEANRPQTMMDQAKQGLASLTDSFSTLGQSIASTLGTALSSISENLTGLILQTKTWGDALRGIAQTILQSVVGAIVQASVQWIARKLIEFVLGSALQKAALASAIPVAAGLSALWAGPATLATIASFGGAAIAAPAEITGAVAITKGLGIAGFDVGGYTGPGGVKELAGFAHKGEVIWSQRDVARAGGVQVVENMRVSGGRSDRTESMLGSGAGSGGGGRGPVTASTTQPVYQAFYNTQQDAETWLSSQKGRRVMTDFIKRESYVQS